MTDLPVRALSVRQPWAWAIVYAGKDVENRSWQAVNHGLNVRGPICVHASKGMTRSEYEDATVFIERLTGAPAPAPDKLLRGGIIGTVDVVDVVTESDSPWFFGPRGLVLANAQPVPFIPSVGALGYFFWQQADDSVVPVPAKWMIRPEGAGQLRGSEVDMFGREAGNG
jgi:hypothetical protein